MASIFGGKSKVEDVESPNSEKDVARPSSEKDIDVLINADPSPPGRRSPDLISNITAPPAKRTEEVNRYESPLERLGTIYNREAVTHDTSLVDYLSSDLDALVTFAGLFSAAVTAFIIDSYKTLQPDPAEVTNTYLLQLSQQIASGSGASAIQPAPFTPDATDILINKLWISSLVISLACALGALLAQSWTKRYKRHVLSAQGGSTQRKAMLRAYLRDGIGRSGLEALTVVLPAFMHVSLFLFFAGLILFIRGLEASPGLEHTIITLVCIWSALYLAFTLAPFVNNNSPYVTPLTPVIRMLLVFPFIAAVYIWEVGSRLKDAIQEKDTHIAKRMVELVNWDFVWSWLRGEPRPEFTYRRLRKAMKWLMQQFDAPKEASRFLDVAHDILIVPEISPQVVDTVMTLSSDMLYFEGVDIIDQVLDYVVYYPEDGKRGKYAKSGAAFLCSLARHSTTDQRLTLSRHTEHTTVWMDICDEVLLERLSALKADTSFEVALYAYCASTAIASCTIKDISTRITSNDVTIDAPPAWDSQSTISLLGDPNRMPELRSELREFLVILHFLPSYRDADEDGESPYVVFDPPVPTSHGRKIRVKIGSGDQPLTAEMLLYESLLIALVDFLQFVLPQPPIPLAIELVSSVISIVTKAWDTVPHHADMKACVTEPSQRHFASILKRMFLSRASGTMEEKDAPAVTPTTSLWLNEVAVTDLHRISQHLNEECVRQGADMLERWKEFQASQSRMKGKRALSGSSFSTL